MYTVTRTFETELGVPHTLIIKGDFKPEFSKELVETVEDAFFYAIEVLRNNALENKLLENCIMFPDKKILNMFIFYASNGKYKDVIKSYNITTSDFGTSTITINLENKIFRNMSPKEISSLTEHTLREPLWWETFGKKFYYINGYMDKSKLIHQYFEQHEVLKCYYNYNVFFFNIGLDEPEITEHMIEEGDWFVYAWI